MAKTIKAIVPKEIASEASETVSENEAVASESDTDTAPKPQPIFRKVESESVRILWSEEKNAFCVYPLSPNAKSLFSLKKIKKGAILENTRDQDIFARLADLQTKADKLAELFA